MLNDWEPHYPDSQYWFELWEASAYMAYPFPGSRLEQPAALLRDFTMWGLMREWVELNKKLPKTTGLGKFGDD